jgi:hypothetical protein
MPISRRSPDAVYKQAVYLRRLKLIRPMARSCCILADYDCGQRLSLATERSATSLTRGEIGTQATAARPALVNVMPVLASVFRKPFVAFQPLRFFEFESVFFGIVVKSLVLSTLWYPQLSAGERTSS